MERNTCGMHPARLAMAVVGLTVALVSLPAGAIINPQFTPRDLIRASERVYLLDAGLPVDGALTFRLKETLRGEQGPETLRLHVGRDLPGEQIARAFRGQASAPAALLYRSTDGEEAFDDEPIAMLLIGIEWFAVHEEDGRQVVRADEQQMFSVWGGSADLLAEAARYIQADPRAHFPVRSELAWADEASLGTLAVAPHGAMVVDLGQPVGRVVLVYSPQGDRLYRAGTDGAEPQDVTARLGLATASRLAVPGDFTGDGRIDLATWDGARLSIAGRDESGAFTAAVPIAPLDACLSLDVVRVGGRTALLAGTPTGAVLVVAGGSAGGYEVRPLSGAAQAEPLGPGGFCLVADVDGDGRPDVMQFHAEGFLLYAGQADGFAAPHAVRMPLPGSARAAITGDFTHDGRLDVMVGGDGGMALLGRRDGQRWENLTHVTYELNHHGNQHAPRLTAMVPVEVNQDGRQGVALFYADRKPMLFFNRGFACFGWARELDVDADEHSLAGPSVRTDPQEELDGLHAMRRGQSAGVVTDLDGDGLPDLFAVAAGTHEAWAIFAERGEGGPLRQLELSVPASSGPLTVTIREPGRTHAPGGTYVVRPGMPVVVSRGRAGPVELTWTDAQGREHRRQQVVVGREHRVVLAAPAEGSGS